MKTFNEKTKEKNIKVFADLEKDNFAILNLKKNEQIKHCIDNKMPEYYHTGWAVTSEGRVWSLNRNRWLVPRNQNGYWRVENIYVHRLVDYYFLSDEEKIIKMVLEEHNKNCNESDRWSGEVHHIIAGSKADSTKMTNEERIEACMKVNNKANLFFQIENVDHKDVHRIMKGEKTIGEKKGTEQLDVFNSIVRNSKPSAYISYDENGKKMINMTLKLKGTTPEEDERLDKEIGHKFLA
ncbi:MAG: hypothetical protein IJZ85_06095 [Lachnospiraceae bacterium]|nr:hypothetical protein [Lachnospiraceae bacterium]